VPGWVQDEGPDDPRESDDYGGAGTLEEPVGPTLSRQSRHRERRVTQMPENNKKHIQTWIHGKLGSNRFQNKIVTQTRLQGIVASSTFSAVTTGIICTNTVLIGVETQAASNSLAWSAVEIVFILSYTLELLVRVLAGGVSLFRKDSWICFDTFVLLIAYLDVCIITPFLTDAGQAKQVALVLRITRLLKLIRIIRLLRFFKELWLLVASFMSACKTLVWTFILLMLVLYIFAMIFVKTMKDSSNEDVEIWFGSMGGSMFTLFQIMTLEGWPEIARTVWRTDEWFMVFPILIFILISSFAIMNTFLAVIVERTLMEGMDQRDDMLKRATAELHRAGDVLVSIFRMADGDNSGLISKQEFVAALTDPKVRQRLQEMELGEEFSCLKPEEIGYIFETIDIDDSSQLNPQEFVDGLMQMRGAARARRIFELHCSMRKKHKMLHRTVTEVESQVDAFEDQLTRDAGTQLAAFSLLESRCKSEFSTLSHRLGKIASRVGRSQFAPVHRRSRVLIGPPIPTKEVP